MSTVGFGHYTWKVTKEQVQTLVETYLHVGYSIPDALLCSQRLFEKDDWHTAVDTVRLLIRIEKIVNENHNLTLPKHLGASQFDDWIRECLK